MNYENQKRINIKNFNNILHKPDTSDAFLQPINWKYYDEALEKLSPNAFKLWFYILKWTGKGYYDFAPAKLTKALKMKSKNTVYAARDELIKENYLIEHTDNTLWFYPCGHADLIYQKKID